MKAPVLAGLLPLLLVAAPVGAQQRGADDAAAVAATERAPISLTPAQEERARELEGALKCPVCRSQSIRSSDSFMAKDMRRKIRAMVAAGRGDQEIVAYFTARYGDWILLAPPKRGFTWIGWLLPFAVVLAGGAGVFLAARRWTRGSRGESGEVPIGPPPESPYLDRLERELEESE
ncbi:MAG: cytochrome c-type biogenesis protein CcmH [Gemmatimonadetes bacterium]|nr:cytochrome c-type biogenesis protein CcmH [Gemmatimonadota bacterium]